MSKSLDERVSKLEEQLAALLSKQRAPLPKKDWRQTIGMFAGDEIMKQIDDEGRKIRESERRKARSRSSRRTTRVLK
jgi:hypothetical protein